MSEDDKFAKLPETLRQQIAEQYAKSAQQAAEDAKKAAGGQPLWRRIFAGPSKSERRAREDLTKR